MTTTDSRDGGTSPNAIPLPSFFIVGAPRCGTTALSDFLNQHPDLYLSYVKEPHYFGSDLAIRRGYNSLEDYLELFRDARGRQCGEASTWYLFSRRAAQEIHTFNPDARILIMLRNPADMLYSWHGYMLLTGEETIEDFSEALLAQAERRQGKRLPKGTPLHKLLYSDIPRYTEQIERFYAVFAPQNIHIILYDDFRGNQQLAMRNAFAFLGVDPAFKPAIRRVNAHGQPINRRIQSLTNHQSNLVRRLVRTVLPRRMRSQLRYSLQSLNTRPSQRPALAPEVRQRLNEEFTQEIRQLSMLLKRDLTHWVENRA